MSLREIEIVCDWPGCGMTACIPYYPAVFRDWNWAWRGTDDLRGHHLCPQHRNAFASELQEAIRIHNCADEIRTWEEF